MSPEDMSTRELLELASLDALGLLDHEERRLFEQAFAIAPAAVKSQLRREQQRLTSVDDFLPKVEAPAGLKQRVIAAVREAIAVMASSEQEPAVIGRLAPRAWSLRGNVSPLWRAACIGFATATVVLLSVGYSLTSEYRQTMNEWLSGEVVAEINQQLGPKFVNLLMDRDAQRVVFNPVASDLESACNAVVMINPETRTGMLICKGLPLLDGEYQLVLVDADSEEIASTLAKFTTKGELVSRELMAGEILPGMKLAIISTLPSGQPGKPVLASSTLAFGSTVSGGVL